MGSLFYRTKLMLLVAQLVKKIHAFVGTLRLILFCIPHHEAIVVQHIEPPTFSEVQKQQQMSTSYITAQKKERKNKLRGLSLQANYTNRATSACRRSDCQLLLREGATRPA
jgi:hypothetical protein